MSKLTIKNDLQTELSIEHTSGSGAKLLGSQDFKYIRDTIKDLSDISPNDGDIVLVKGYHEINDGGGGLFVYSSDEPKSNHNGGTVIDSSKIFPDDWTNQTELTDWFTGSNNTNGCWNRIYESSVNVKWFGAKGDSIIDDTLPIQQSINNTYYINYESNWIDKTNIYKVYIPKGQYKCSTINIYKSIHLFGEGELIQLNDSNLLNIGDGVNNITDYMIEGLTLKATNASDTQTSGIIIRKGMFNGIIKNIYIEGFDYNIDIAESWTLEIHNCISVKARQANLIWDGAVNGKIYGGRYEESLNHGIKLLSNDTETQALLLEGVAIQGNALSGLYAEINSIKLDSCFMERNCQANNDYAHLHLRPKGEGIININSTYVIRSSTGGGGLGGIYVDPIDDLSHIVNISNSYIHSNNATDGFDFGIKTEGWVSRLTVQDTLAVGRLNNILYTQPGTNVLISNQSGIQFNGILRTDSLFLGVDITNSNYTFDENATRSCVIFSQDASGGRDVNLPENTYKGRIVIIKKGYTGGNLIRVYAPNGKTIEGNDYIDIKGDYETLMLIYNGIDTWYSIRDNRLVINEPKQWANEVLKMSNIPTSDPSVAGQLWNDNGTVKISAG